MNNHGVTPYLAFHQQSPPHSCHGRMRSAVQNSCPRGGSRLLALSYSERVVTAKTKFLMQQDSTSGWEQSSAPELEEHLSSPQLHDDRSNYPTPSWMLLTGSYQQGWAPKKRHLVNPDLPSHASSFLLQEQFQLSLMVTTPRNFLQSQRELWSHGIWV